MAIRDWINEFLDGHQARFDPHDWPEEDADDEQREFIRGWVTAFNLKEVSRPEAEEASRRLALDPPNFRREHIPKVIAAVLALRAERGPRASGPSSRDAALLASKDCPHCGGCGLAVAYHPWPDAAKAIAPTTAAHCVCAYGRWIRRTHQEKNPELLRRIPDFGRVLDGATVYLPENPAFAGLVEEGSESGPLRPSEMIGRLLKRATDPPTVAPEMVRSRRVDAGEDIGVAARFLVGMLTASPTRLSLILASAIKYEISHSSIYHAAEKLEVRRSVIDGEEAWDLAGGAMPSNPTGVSVP